MLRSIRNVAAERVPALSRTTHRVGTTYGSGMLPALVGAASNRSAEIRAEPWAPPPATSSVAPTRVPNRYVPAPVKAREVTAGSRSTRSSTPVDPSEAAAIKAPWLVRRLVAARPVSEPGFRSRVRTVPPMVPSVCHNSAPVSFAEARK